MLRDAGSSKPSDERGCVGRKKEGKETLSSSPNVGVGLNKRGGVRGLLKEREVERRLSLVTQGGSARGTNLNPEVCTLTRREAGESELSATATGRHEMRI